MPVISSETKGNLETKRKAVADALEEAQAAQQTFWDAVSNLETQIAFLHNLDADRVELDGYGDLSSYTVDSIIKEATIYEDDEPEEDEG
jgi:hypothetical protein